MKAMAATKIRIYLRLLCFLLFIFGIVIPVALFIVTNNLYDQNAVSRGDLHLRGEPVLAAVHTHERKPLDYPESRDEVDVIGFQIKELEEIRASVRNELRTMDQQRIKLNKDLDSGKDTLTQLKKELGRTKMELQNTKGKLARASREANKGSLASPLQINPAPIVVVNMPPKTHVVEDPHVEVGRSKKTTQSEECTFQRCFDFSKCLHNKPFKVYVYNKFSPYNKLFDLKHPKIVSDLVRSLSATNSLTADASEACVYVCLVGPLTTQLDEEALLQKISQLSHWGRQGENHILVDMLYAESAQPSPLDSMPVGRAIVSYGHPALINEHHHILLPPVTIVSNEPLWKGLPPHLPATRQTLVHFTGSLNNGVSEAVITVDELKAIYDTISAKTSDKVIIETHCDDSDGDIRERNNQLEDRLSPTLLFRGEWALCGTHQTRLTRLATSTFSLVIGAKTGLNGFSTYTRLIEALRSGAIPVVTGVDHLPLEAVIDWKKAVVFLPASLIGELHYTLRHIDDNTILEYRRQGRFLWSTYFSSPLKILDSLLAVVRFKAHHPPPPPPSLQYHNLSTLVSIPSDTVRLISVPVFRYNFSVYSTDVWNSPPGPFTMYPLTPFQPAPVSGTQFMGMANHLNFPTHVIEGGGITGPFFEDYLLGNTPEEQFTIVLLTYKRNDVLLQALDYLHDLSYLAKVIVIWNSPSAPQSNMAWPDIGVPLEVVSAGRNSLNNRFLPLSSIQTEAVLSLDDDVHLRHDEIQFAFRVWREARDRIVGFPGRFHAWDVRHPGWLYNSNYTCELSMVLTGAAFIHKYYLHLYTQWMPQEIRDIVDSHMNCEDIAMNFLVSHITRKPPLKVTSRWTFRCAGCPETLSTSYEHFTERHVCMNKFVEIYGYMPLLYTQFRADSVLFKTRLPSHLEKCYQFV